MSNPEIDNVEWSQARLGIRSAYTIRKTST